MRYSGRDPSQLPSSLRVNKLLPYSVLPYWKNSDRIRRYERFAYMECITHQVRHVRMARVDCRRFYVCECAAGGDGNRGAREQQDEEPDDFGGVRYEILFGGVFAAG